MSVGRLTPRRGRHGKLVQAHAPSGPERRLARAATPPRRRLEGAPARPSVPIESGDAAAQSGVGRPRRARQLVRPSGRRAQLTGYGSPLLARASHAAPKVWLIPGTGLRRMVQLLRSGLPLLTLYVLALPTVRLRLSDRATAQVMRDQFNQRRNGRWYFRHAQGVLFLPDSAAAYLRGRSRQAVRTNVRRAREAGLTIVHQHAEQWTLPRKDPRFITDRPAMPAEVWNVFDADGSKVADGLVTIEGRVALLHIASATNNHAGWLLQVEIIQWLCGRCDLMIVNSEDVPLLSAGMQHFQRLLGYSIVRLRIHPTRAELRRHLPALRIGLTCLGAAAIMVLAQRLLTREPSITGTAIVWVTALVAVRRASQRAGLAAVTGLMAGFAYVCADGWRSPEVSVAWTVAGITLDLLLARVPRLTWGVVAVAPAGVMVALLALSIAQAGHLLLSDDPAHAHVSTWGEIALAGAWAAGLGWWLGGRLMRVLPVAAET